VVDDDPPAFEDYLRAVVTRTFSDNRYLQSLIILGPWNEWSEGCYLLPDQRFGLGKLRAVKRVKEAALCAH